MEEKIKQLEHKVEVLTGVVFIILKETGLLEKALNGSIVSAVKRAAEESKEERQDKSKSKSVGEFASILEEFDADGKELKN